jgi:ATP adenylyltransferase
VAGASQPHRHLQLIPLPLVPAAGAQPPVPVETLFDAAPAFGRVAGLPFAHAFARLADPTDAAEVLDVYHALLAAAGLHVVAREIGACASAPYNLLATRRWMLVVPRSQGRLDDGVSINALGYAGSFFARDAAEEETLRRSGPMAALQCVALPLASLPA